MSIFKSRILDFTKNIKEPTFGTLTNHNLVPNVNWEATLKKVQRGY